MSKVRIKQRRIDPDLHCNPDGTAVTYRGCNPFYRGVTHVILRGDGNGHPMHVAGVHFGGDIGKVHKYMSERMGLDTVVVPVSTAMRKYNFRPVGTPYASPHEPHHIYTTQL